jgi:hypothetical protein
LTITEGNKPKRLCSFWVISGTAIRALSTGAQGSDNFCYPNKPADPGVFLKILGFQSVTGFSDVWHHPCPLKNRNARKKRRQRQTKDN